MPKAKFGKSSASAGTRKKHAAKKAAAQGDDRAASVSSKGGQQQKGGGKKGAKKGRNEPKIKRFVPPPPPPKGEPSPIDLYLAGGAGVDAELLIVLRRLDKRDESTVFKGIEGFESWIRETMAQEEALAKGAADVEDWQVAARSEELVRACAAWTHHFPRLVLHPARQVRASAASFHDLLVSHRRKESTLLKDTRTALLEVQWVERTDYMGAWYLATFDHDRGVRGSARRSWDSVFKARDDAAPPYTFEEMIPTLWDYAQETALGRTAQVANVSDETADDVALVKAQAILALAELLHRASSAETLSEERLTVVGSDEVWELFSPTQPTVARTACCTLLESAASLTASEPLLVNLKGVAHRVLGNCWNEGDGWAGIITFLRKYPQAWSLANEGLEADSDSEDEDEEDEEEDEDEDDVTGSGTEGAATESKAAPVSPVISLFTQYLENACAGRPQNYPTVILLLSSIPPQLLPTQTIDTFLSSFFLATKSRTLASLGSDGLARSSSVDSFSRAFLECLLRLTSRIEGEEESTVFLTTWLRRFVDAFLKPQEGTAALASAASATVLAETAQRLSKQSSARGAAALSVVHVGSLSTISATATPAAALSLLVHAFAKSDDGNVAFKGRDTARKAVLEATQLLRASERESRRGSAALFDLCVLVRDLIDDEDQRSHQALAAVATKAVPSSLLSRSVLATSAKSYLSAILKRDTSVRQAVWSAVFASSLPASTLRDLVALAASEGLAETCHGPADDAILFKSQSIFQSDEIVPAVLDDVSLLAAMLQAGGVSLCSTEALQEIVTLASTRLSDSVHRGLSLDAATPSPAGLAIPIQLLGAYAQRPQADTSFWSSDIGIDAATSLFLVSQLLAHILSEEQLSDESASLAFTSWTIVAPATPGATASIETVLATQLREARSRASSSHIVEAWTALDRPAAEFSRILPGQARTVSQAAIRHRSPPQLSVSDALVPLVYDMDDEDNEDGEQSAATDVDGFTAYTRPLVAMLELSARDRTWASDNAWLISHLALLGEIAEDASKVEGSAQFAFRAACAETALRSVADASVGLVTYVVSSAARKLPVDWHADAIASIKSGGHSTQDIISSLLELAAAARGGSITAARATRRVLSLLLQHSDASIEDLQTWWTFAQREADKAPELGLAIIEVLRDHLAESSQSERFRNGLAAELAGVPPAKVNSQGAKLLRVLVAVAPSQDSDTILLPQQRVVFLLRSVRTWLIGDEDVGDDLYANLCRLFTLVAAIVQDLSGSHWDSMLDVLEASFELFDWEEASTLPLAYHGCHLLLEVKSLVERNAGLREQLGQRLEAIYSAVLSKFLEKQVERTRDEARVGTVHLMWQVIAALPTKMVRSDQTVDQLLGLLRERTVPLQISAYHLLAQIIRSRTQDQVVEAELSDLTSSMPDELVSQLKIAAVGSDVASRSAALLSWLVVFRFFDEASPRLRTDYIAQLRQLDLVATSLLPLVLSELQVSDRGKPVDLSVWQVDQFQVGSLAADSNESVRLLAALVFYESLQAVPSLVRSWWEGCKNKQLSLAFASTISRYFSPVLVDNQLVHLRDPTDVLAKPLRDDPNFSVKVSSTTSEVKATYVVDEQTMEITVRLPPDFPLQSVEVKDVRKIGVTEATWRAWLLAVQQVLTTQGGKIVDALTLFKRNVSLHFEGVEACAICYSIISVTDRTLPNKSCRTCNNKFHASCLFKWFSTSHSSSCPLCRSLF